MINNIGNIRALKKLIILAILLFIFIGIPGNVYSQMSSDIYQLALQKEIGEGNLEEAIQLYSQVVSDADAERKIRANAQLHVGICYEKLGEKKAKDAYQNVLKNFADQKDVVDEARERIQKFVPELPKVYPQAQEAYIKAVHYTGMGNVQRIVGYYNQAIALDSNFAQAYSGLAKTYVFSGGMGAPKERMPIANANALKALELNPNLEEAHAVLGLVNMFYYWDWTKAESEYKKALKINPNNSETIQYYAILLSSQGRLEEALIELKKAIQVDPVNHYINETMADVYYYLRDYDQAITQYLKTLELHPHSRVTHLKLSGVYHQQNREDEEILSINRYFLAKRDTVLSNLFMKTYKEHGYKRAIMSWIKAWEPYGKGKGVQSTSIALTYMRIDDYEKTFEWLQGGYDLRNKDMILIGVRPIFDDLRSDARLLELLDKIGLPH